MRVCRLTLNGEPTAAFYSESTCVPVGAAGAGFRAATGRSANLPTGDDLLAFLPTSPGYQAARAVAAWVASVGRVSGDIPTASAELLVPIPRPNKLLLLAGNYADHVRERGGTTAEQRETFPYVFMKPPSTTLTAPNRAIAIPAEAPDGVDWEAELCVVIGQRGKAIPEAEALSFVAGYTVLNDITQRKYRPNPGRKKRERDTFFDWLHGKWFDGFAPCGPGIACPDAVPDPQALAVRLDLNGERKQDGNTGQMVFPVAAVISFISRFVTLEPGDLISTGTPAGVGSASGTFLKPGDVLRASIDGIGTLVTPVVAEVL